MMFAAMGAVGKMIEKDIQELNQMCRHVRG